MYHVELRQFPHNSSRFNLSEGELHETILDGWARGDWVEFGERKWSPEQATLTVIEGPELPLNDISMGRGWRNATRRGRDVTEELIAAARSQQALAPNAGSRPNRDGAQAAVAGALAGSEPEQLATELLALLGEHPVPLIRAWQLALERHPDRTPSECLALAEDFLRG